MARRPVVGLLSGLLILAGATAVEAQAPKEGSRAYNPTRRVPMYFGQVGLSESQREEIYNIRAKYYEQITNLKRQIEELEGKQSTDCDGVLSESQRKLLETLRNSRRVSTRAATTAKTEVETPKPAAAAAPAPPATPEPPPPPADPEKPKAP